MYLSPGTIDRQKQSTNCCSLPVVSRPVVHLCLGLLLASVHQGHISFPGCFRTFSEFELFGGWGEANPLLITTTTTTTTTTTATKQPQLERRSQTIEFETQRAKGCVVSIERCAGCRRKTRGGGRSGHLTSKCGNMQQTMQFFLIFCYCEELP